MDRKTLLGGALVLALAAGCQEAADLPTGAFGVTVTDRPAVATALPPSLTGGREVRLDSFRPGELLVQLADGADADRALAGYACFGTVRLGHRVAGVRLPAGTDLARAFAELRGRPGVLQVTLNWRQHKTATYTEPGDPRFAEQWSHRQTEALALWESDDARKNVDASKVIVAILDTGLDVTHPEFAGRVVLPRDFSAMEATDSPTPAQPGVGAIDLEGHGTHVAGIIGAAGHNSLGVAGVAWDVKLMPLKVLGEQGGTDFAILEAIAYALGLDGDDPDELDNDGYLKELPAGQEDLRTRVISMSLGSALQGRSPLYDDAFAAARRHGVVVVVAAGNDGGEVAQPANSNDCIAVSSTSPYQVGDHIWEWLSGYSNRGDRIDLAAPGGGILSTIPVASGSYDVYSGTSMACPYVSGLAALVAAQNDPANSHTDAAFVDALKQHLEATADDLGSPGKDPKYGYGRVNVRRALTVAFPAGLP